jgi:hypothetical protein
VYVFLEDGIDRIVLRHEVEQDEGQITESVYVEDVKSGEGYVLWRILDKGNKYNYLQPAHTFAAWYLAYKGGHKQAMKWYTDYVEDLEASVRNKRLGEVNE